MARKTRTETELDDILERVTRAEEQLKHATSAAQTSHKEVQESLNSIESRIAIMERSLTKYQGFIGGIMLILTAVGTFLTLFWDIISRKFGWVK